MRSVRTIRGRSPRGDEATAVDLPSNPQGALQQAQVVEPDRQPRVPGKPTIAAGRGVDRAEAKRDGRGGGSRGEHDKADRQDDEEAWLSRDRLIGATLEQRRRDAIMRPDAADRHPPQAGGDLCRRCRRGVLRVGLAEAFPPAPAPGLAAFAVTWSGPGARLLLALPRHPGRACAIPPRDRDLRHPDHLLALQLELYELVDGGETGLAAAYCAATVIAGYLLVRSGSSSRRGGRTVLPAARGSAVSAPAGSRSGSWAGSPRAPLRARLEISTRARGTSARHPRRQPRRRLALGRPGRPSTASCG